MSAQAGPSFPGFEVGARTAPSGVKRPAQDSNCVRQLLVQSGMHAGALIKLKNGSNVLGHAPDCDVVLADEGLAARHLDIVLEGRSAWIRRLEDAPLEVNGRRLESQRAIVRPGTVISVGACRIILQSPLATDSDPDVDGGTADSPLAGIYSSLLAGRWLMLAVLGLGIFGIWWAWSDGLATRTHASQYASKTTAAQLFEQGFRNLNLADVQLLTVGQNNYRLSGFVDNQQQAQTLSALAKNAPALRVESHVAVGSQIAAWISDSVANPEVSVRYTGKGEVIIEGEVRALNHRARLEQVNEQFARLVRINDKTRPPAEPKSVVVRALEPTSLPYRAVPVISGRGGNVTHVLAHEQRRYFVGAVLPDGSVLEAVDAKQVVVIDRLGRRQTFSL